ncbi:lysophospholipid transporter LplT [Roseateles sp. DAIF2]|nr:lysophospholipid transporter LplT [Roseateles sp. DAIF2]
MPRGFHALLGAQFCSALADNALLIVTIALLQRRGLPLWWAPLLKVGFTLSYVLLAPLVGPLADAVPKARLMAWMNGLKIVGLAGMLLGWHPVLAYSLVGLGAAAYAPAKYGLVTELVPARALVAANGWLEVSIVGAALLGTVLGGLLVAPWLGLPSLGAQGLDCSLAALAGLYALAALLQLAVPDSGARYPAAPLLRPLALTRDFWRSHRRLWRDAEGGLSLAVTTLFWGVGATLQLAVLRWAELRLGLPLERAAWLQAAVAIGVVVGAALAGRCVPLAAAWRVLPLGLLLGLLIIAIAWVQDLALALPLLALTGAVGGLLVVPMNALLQHRGYQLLSAGRSIAVQGFNENLSVLLMLGAYAGALALELPLLPLMSGFGALIALAMAALLWRRGRAAPSSSRRLGRDVGAG